MYSLGDHVDKLLPIYGSTATEEPVIVLLQFCRAKIFDTSSLREKYARDWFGLDDFADFEMIGFDEGGSSGSVVVTPKRSLMDEFNQEEDPKRIKGSVVKVEKI
nr:replication protein A 70 kDa DNA-binding subunit B-like [Ipomoea batatas]GMD63372.1 replication protein A 70 kDa DNA-binding subunit B-like [Ipomoea batatas]